jgi:hypothetical protein
MQVRFISDSSTTGDGFVGNWNVLKTSVCSLCPAGKPPSPPNHTPAGCHGVTHAGIGPEEIWVS